MCEDNLGASLRVMSGFSIEEFSINCVLVVKRIWLHNVIAEGGSKHTTSCLSASG